MRLSQYQTRVPSSVGVTLEPIEPKPLKKLKNPWCESIDFLTDLKTKQNILLQQIQGEILALKREQDLPNE